MTELSKRLEEGDWILTVQEGIDPKVLAVGTPNLPMRVLDACSLQGGAAGDSFVSRDKCSFECTALVRWQETTWWCATLPHGSKVLLLIRPVGLLCVTGLRWVDCVNGLRHSRAWVL